MKWQDKYRNKLITAKQSAELVTNGADVLFSMMDQPGDIILEISNRYQSLKNITLTSHWVADYPFLHPKQYPEMAKTFIVKDPMTLRTTREAVRDKTIDWQPTVFGLSNGERQKCTDRGRLYHHKDFFFFKLTPPDDNGDCSFGPYTWYSPNACKTAKLKIAEIDPHLPRVNGDSVNIESIDYLVEAPKAEDTGRKEVLGFTPSKEEWEISQVIGANAASLIQDGDTLQIGVGTSSEAITGFLADKNDLGFDSEVIYVELVDLVKRGVINGRKKNIDTGIAASSCLQIYGRNTPASNEALAFVKGNPSFIFRDISTQCNIARIASQNNMVAINSILSVDLLGQVVLTHIGPTPIGGPGGQIEFCIGAHYCKGGRSVSMLKSTAVDGKASRIVPKFEKGTVIAIPMFYLDYLVTEFGTVNLDCKSRRERAEAIISVAHPDFQPELRRAAREMFYP